VHPVFYDRAGSVEQAIALARQPGARFIGGGTNLLDLYKSGIEQPLRLVDVSRLALDGIEELPDGGLRLGATTTNTAAANHPLVRQRYRLLSEALLSGASPQLRNMATVGGNLLQRTRCHYFTDPGFASCNKRAPGSGCAALEGHNRIHAILGASEHCIATNPSDMSVALCALDAVVRITGPDGERTVAVGDFHRLPGDTPQFDSVIEPGELITAVDLPPSSFSHAHYLKLRDRASYAFALVSVAAALELHDGVVRELRLVLGGVAHKPWRAREAEDALRGHALDDEALLRRAAAAALAQARPRAHNAFKVELAQRAIVRALRLAGGAA
jgi:xanthine dehydrogenase YagS FAD-binding subunit